MAWAFVVCECAGPRDATCASTSDPVHHSACVSGRTPAPWWLSRRCPCRGPRRPMARDLPPPSPRQRSLSWEDPSQERNMTSFTHPRELVDAFAERLNAKDSSALGELFDQNAEFVNIMGMRMRGRQGIIDGHGWAF